MGELRKRLFRGGYSNRTVHTAAYDEREKAKPPAFTLEKKTAEELSETLTVSVAVSKHCLLNSIQLNGENF